MKITVYSDVHGNLITLEKLYKLEKDSDLFICLGDVVGYGPHCNECVEFLNSSEKTLCILGNHEEMYLQGAYAKNCSKLAKNFFNHTFPLFKEKNLEIISLYKKEIDKFNYIFTHTINNSYIYPNTQVKELKNNIFIGHSHVQFEKNIGNKKLVNTGSLGQNRKHKNIANYVVLENFMPKLKNFTYDVNLLIQDMVDLNYPINLVNYYKIKN